MLRRREIAPSLRAVRNELRGNPLQVCNGFLTLFGMTVYSNGTAELLRSARNDAKRVFFFVSSLYDCFAVNCDDIFFVSKNAILFSKKIVSLQIV